VQTTEYKERHDDGAYRTDAANQAELRKSSNALTGFCLFTAIQNLILR